MRNIYFFLCCLCLSLLPLPSFAQLNEIVNPHVASLQVVAGTDWMEMPVIELDGDKPVNISFDELSHTYHRYVYRIDHCEADWATSSELFESDFVDGFAADNTIDDVQQSDGTNQQYTHYAFSIPNDRCRLRMSGNYRVTVTDADNGNEPVLTACFMVVEQRMGVGLQMTTNTDTGVNTIYQQLSMSLNYNGMAVTQPPQQIKTFVLQNARWDNAVRNPHAQYIRSDGLRWEHCRDLIFTAGNEYRKFEMLDVTHTTMGLERVGWDGRQYQAWVWLCEPRPNYVYDEDANGAFLIRNSDNQNNDTESDYAVVHFTLKTESSLFDAHGDTLPKDIYVNGVWTNDRFTPKYRMRWNAAMRQYECAVLLKQGYYSYQFLMRRDDGSFVTLPSEGNFYQTENNYQVLVYYRGQGERTDRLVAFATLKK